MSGLGALWGFIKSKLGSAAFRDVGTSAGNVVALNGSAQLPAVDGSLLTGVGSGGAGVESYTEVATLAALQSALANGARLLVTDDIAMGTTDTIDLTSITSLTVAIKDGKKISHSGTADIFSASSGTCRLTLETGPRTASTPAFEVTGSGKIANSSGTLILDWSKRLHIDGPTGAWTPFGSGVKLDAERAFLVIDAGNGIVTVGSSGYGGVGGIIFNGGGTSSALRLWCRCGPVTFRGSCRGFASTYSSDYTLMVQRIATQNSIPVGPVFFDMDGVTYTPVVYAVGPVEIYGVESSSASYYPRVAPSFGAKVYGGKFFPAFINAAETPGHFHGSHFAGVAFSSAKCGEIVGCEFASGVTFTFPSGSKPRIRGCDLRGTVIFQSGSEPVVDQSNVMGTVTIDSGAGGRFTSLQDGGGTLTNNDPLSVVTGSEDVAKDTTPSTRRFNNATLDAILDRLAAYYDLKDADLAFVDKSHKRARRPIYGSRPTGITADSSGIYFGDTGDWAAGGEFSAPAGAPLSIAFAFTPDDATPGANRIMLGVNAPGGTAGIGIDLNTSGGVNLWSDSAYRITGAAALSDGVESIIELVRRSDSGTDTWHLFVDGVDVGSSAAGMADLYNALITLGRFGTSIAPNAAPGYMRALSIWDIGHSDAQAVALAANPELIGAGL